jgi:hypothetical protein
VSASSTKFTIWLATALRVHDPAGDPPGNGFLLVYLLKFSQTNWAIYGGYAFTALLNRAGNANALVVDLEMGTEHF